VSRYVKPSKHWRQKKKEQQPRSLLPPSFMRAYRPAVAKICEAGLQTVGKKQVKFHNAQATARKYVK
jgi:hypothetical protein